MRVTARFTLVMTAALLALAACNDKKAAANFDEDMSLGSAKAPVTMIEYASVTCPHCAAWNAETFPAFKTKYIDTGKVHYILREAPIHGAIDIMGYRLARCAGKDKYFQVVEAIMRSQTQVFAAPRDTYLGIAESVGMNESQFDACENDETATNKMVERTKKEMAEYNVEGTPTFIVNGKTVAETAVPLDQLSAAIDPLLAGKK